MFNRISDFEAVRNGDGELVLQPGCKTPGKPRRLIRRLVKRLRDTVIYEVGLCGNECGLFYTQRKKEPGKGEILSSYTRVYFQEPGTGMCGKTDYTPYSGKEPREYMFGTLDDILTDKDSPERIALDLFRNAGASVNQVAGREEFIDANPAVSEEEENDKECKYWSVIEKGTVLMQEITHYYLDIPLFLRRNKDIFTRTDRTDLYRREGLCRVFSGIVAFEKDEKPFATFNDTERNRKTFLDILNDTEKEPYEDEEDFLATVADKVTTLICNADASAAIIEALKQNPLVEDASYEPGRDALTILTRKGFISPVDTDAYFHLCPDYGYFEGHYDGDKGPYDFAGMFSGEKGLHPDILCYEQLVTEEPDCLKAVLAACDEADYTPWHIYIKTI